MIKIVPYGKDLLKEWIYTGREKDLFSGPEDVRSTIDEYATRGRAYIGYNRAGEIIGAAGILPINPWGTGYSWSFINPEAVTDAKDMIRTIIECEKELSIEMGLHRLQSECDENDLDLTKYMTLLEYQIEGVLKKKGPDQKNMNLFAKLYD